MPGTDDPSLLFSVAQPETPSQEGQRPALMTEKPFTNKYPLHTLQQEHMKPYESNQGIPAGEFRPFLHTTKLLSLFLFCLAWVTLIYSPGLSRGADRETTLFLPLKINSATDVDRLQELKAQYAADSALGR